MNSGTGFGTDGVVTTEIDSESPESRHWYTFGIFVASTLTYSWGLWALLVFGIVPASATTPLILLGGFGPFVGALVTLRLTGLSVRTWLRSNLRYRLSLRWYALAVVLPPILIVASSIIYVTVFDASYAFDELAALWMFPLGLALTFAVGGGNEELGWRGFAQPALQEGLSAFTASVLIGFVWFVWHIPLFFVPGSSQAGVPMVPYAVGVLATAVVLTWLYNATGSLLIPWLYHASINPAGGYFLAGVDSLKTTPGYGTYALVVAIVAVALLVRYGPTDLAARARVRLSDLT
ncbi:CPBP family intramembrane metalloprotease [Haloferax sp. MBLA0076]|uniref:CPBP family intramembrane metalloprotease n=1 Tax=Haloferax litoreum TaxID=2666140 RepID=A0A6A8GLQ5_9EURY|nr:MULTISPECIES: type II CAAX endopeptidase family protein [Haloferax]KAB1190457.1 CPBP family intramembrane metalloprotease [Haloferax sp. CBA1148]MRX23432.1 CPBP family intramembrane metalloprotease [Haloferax litoreum]